MTYNITNDKAIKLLKVFPSNLMYVWGPDSYIDDFIKPLKSTGYNVISTTKLKNMCKTQESFITNIQNRINKSKETPMILYGKLTIDEIDTIFDENQFNYIFIYPNSKTIVNRIKTESKKVLKEVSKTYKSHLDHYEKMLVVLMD